MSPGRCALPSGMFSTRPIAPIALTFALRPASACISPTTQAAPAMSPFMSSMLAAGLIEMPPVSKHTPLPMKASGAAPFLPPFQRMITTRLSCAEPCPTPSSAPMPSLRIALHVEHVDADAELAQLRRAARELDREKNVRRLVDEIARQDHALGNGLARAPGLARGRDVGDAERHAQARRVSPRLPCAWSCSDRTCRRAATRRAPRRRRHRPSVRRRRVRARSSPCRQRAGMRPIAMPPSLTKSSSLRSAALPVPITISRETFSPAGATMSSTEPLLPVNFSDRAARATRSAAEPSTARVFGPRRTSPSANTTRTPLDGADIAAKASFGASAIEVLSGANRGRANLRRNSTS